MSNLPNHTGTAPAPMSVRERVGVSIGGADARALVDAIINAERLGVHQIWMTQNPSSFDALTLYGAALARTETIRVGTSIVPTYPRHPLALAQQAATVAALGGGRLRLGIGPSHRPAIETAYGIPMESPLAHTREYLSVLRAALWQGDVDVQGRFFTAKATFNQPPHIPLLMSALGTGAFQLAGEIADGAISWNCPVAYLVEQALPALRAGAAAAGRQAPPIVAHMWVALDADQVAVRAAARKALSGYARLPFYAAMFAAAGYPVQGDGEVSDQLIDAIVVAGDAAGVAARLAATLSQGLDELLLTHVALGDPAGERDRLLRFVGQL